jgi:pimeloyl-ACP methyl ester carboxylesterase
MLEEKASSPAREAALAALNGVIGDHLVASNNSLAIPMQFRHNGKPVNKDVLSEAIQQSNGRLAILVHGAFMNDLQWNREGHDHGAALARDLGITPLYLHYNAGRHISENGREFSDLLETTIAQAPRPVELFIIAYSMGGLVARSACHYGKTSGHSWLNSLQKLLFLGTPHHGAPLEKGGNWINIILELNPYSAPFARLGKVRSRGLTDLRYGNVLDEDWQGHDRFGWSGDRRSLVPLPQGVQCYAIAARSGKKSNKLCSDLIGDGLVPVSSALGRHKRPELNLSFPETHQWVGDCRMSHVDLLNHPQVYETIKQWLGT